MVRPNLRRAHRRRNVDVGCGTGAAVRAAAEIVERAVGVDLSPRMLAEACMRAAGLPGVEFVEGDSEDPETVRVPPGR
jgi:ubiquinone/menaquinone biosynthesis C-methylase UbiE